MTLDDVLHSILDGLFEIFPQCQQGFIMLHDQQRDWKRRGFAPGSRPKSRSA
jgi:hypothetical protein